MLSRGPVGLECWPKDCHLLASPLPPLRPHQRAPGTLPPPRLSNESGSWLLSCEDRPFPLSSRGCSSPPPTLWKLTLAPGPWLSPGQVFSGPAYLQGASGHPSPTFPFLTCFVSNDILLPSTPPTQCHGHTWSLSAAEMAPPWRILCRHSSSVVTPSYFSQSITRI